MNIRSLVPWSRQPHVPATLYRDNENPFLALHREMNRLFDEIFDSFDAPTPLRRFSGWSSTWPKVEISESGKEIRVQAEMPGLEEKDIEVLLEDGVLTLRGEKRAEVDDKERQFSERVYGHFERRIPVGDDVEEDRVNAAFKNGVLTVTLPKTPRAQSKAKRIAINGKH